MNNLHCPKCGKFIRIDHMDKPFTTICVAMCNCGYEEELWRRPV